MRGDLLLAAALFLATFAVYRAAPVHQMSDSRFLTAVSQSLLERGTLAVPKELASLPGHTLHLVNERVLFFFSSAPAVLNVPFVLAYNLVGVSVFSEDGIFRWDVEVRILRTAAAAITALTVALSFLLARVFLNRFWSLALTGAFAFGTSLFSAASRAYWSHAWGVCLVTLALYLLLSPRYRSHRGCYVAASTALAWAYFCRPPFALSVVAITVFLAWERRRPLPWFIATGVFWAVLFAMHSLYLYDQILPPYFLSDHLAKARLGPGSLLGFSPEGAWGTLFGPGRGLFLFTPSFALILLYIALQWRRLPSRALAFAGLGVLVAHWKLISSFRNWWGGASFGPRLFTDIIPWFFVLAVLAMAAVLTRRRSTSSAVAHACICLLVTVVSVFVHTRGAMASETYKWGSRDLDWAPLELRAELFKRERLWNWRYPQFLAGLIPVPPPADLISPRCLGRKRRMEARCDHKITVRLRGRRWSPYSLKLRESKLRRGQLGRSGKALEVLDHPAEGKGHVTVLWECGTILTRTYLCPEKP